MKPQTLISALYLSLICTVLTGCFGGGGWGGGSGVTNYYTLNNTASVDSSTGFTKENAPFQIIAPTLQAPMISRRGETRLFFDAGHSISTGAAIGIGESSMLMAQLSFGADKHTVHDSVYLDLEYVTSSDPNGTPVNASGFYHYDRNSTADTKMIELAFGKYSHFGKKFRGEWLLGSGYGISANEHSVEIEEGAYAAVLMDYSATYSVRRSHFNFFSQYDIGWVTKHCELVLIGRMNGQWFTSQESSVTDHTTPPEYGPWAFSFEPGARLALGIRNIKVYAHYETVVPIRTSGVDYFKSQLRMGMVVRLGKP